MKSYKEGEVIYEAIETCPWCGKENTFVNWDVEEQGYMGTCHHCGEIIMLCDECLHANDNKNKKCNWRMDGVYGRCFRGITKRKRHSNKCK